MLTALIALSAVGAGIWLALSGGFLHRWFQPAPLLDPATPRIQGSYTLAEVHTEEDAASYAAAYVLIKIPAIPNCQRKGDQDGLTLYSLPNGPIVQATGQTSEGDVLPLPWMFAGDTSGPKYLRVDIPGGYSNACKFIDITLVTRTGAFPKWRITRLPFMRHDIPDNPAVQTAQTVNGISVTARAWRMRHEIYLQLRPILPPGSHQWEFVNQQSWGMWEKFDQPHRLYADVENAPPIEGRNGRFTGNDTVWYGGLTMRLPADYRSASRFVRLDCGLRQFETLDERVTFPNVSIRPGQMQDYYVSVPAPLTRMTLSGLAVTLPEQGTGGTTSMSGFINFALTVQPLVSPDELPRSPLVQQFHQPIAVNVQPIPSEEIGIRSVEPGDTHTYSLSLPMNPKWVSVKSAKEMLYTPRFVEPPPRKNLTVILRQRVDIQTIPLSFTVPVADTSPPDFHW